MSDQQAPQNGDTPAVAGPTEAPGTAEGQETVADPYEKRYNDLRPQFDRTTQQLAEQKQWLDLLVTSEDVDTQRRALEALGYDVPDEVEDVEAAEYEYEDEFEDPTEQLRKRQEELEERLNQGDQEKQLAQEADLIREITDERLNSLEGLSKEDHDLVLAYAINALPPKRVPGIPVPLPDVEGAFEYFQGRETERQKAWAKTKRAPFVLPGGQSATEAPDLSTHEGRVANMLRKAQEMSDQA